MKIRAALHLSQPQPPPHPSSPKHTHLSRNKIRRILFIYSFIVMLPFVLLPFFVFVFCFVHLSCCLCVFVFLFRSSVLLPWWQNEEEAGTSCHQYEHLFTCSQPVMKGRLCALKYGRQLVSKKGQRQILKETCSFLIKLQNCMNRGQIWRERICPLQLYRTRTDLERDLFISNKLPTEL